MERRSHPRILISRTARSLPVRHLPRKKKCTPSASFTLSASYHLACRGPAPADHGNEAGGQLRLFNRFQRRPQYRYLHPRVAAPHGRSCTRLTLKRITPMEWIAPMLDWGKSHQLIMWWTLAASVAIALLTPIAVAWAVVQLPADYFTREKRRRSSTWEKYAVLRPLYLVAKNLLGFVLLVAGIAMLILPGQGLLTIVIAVILMDFPGKYRLERWLATRRPVWRSLNWLRKRAHRPELQRPEESPA
jgi:hypothetical protein